MAKAAYKKWEGAVEIPIDSLDCDPLNPNVMDDNHFNSLVEAIQKHGFDEPLQVIENKDQPGRFIIVGGEHRWKAAKVLGYPTVPGVIKETLEDDVERHVELVRRNLVRGELDRVKFNKLMKSIEERRSGLDPAKMAAAMGFRNKECMDKLLAKEKAAKSAETQEAMEESRKEINLVDNVSYVLNEIFSKYGETIPFGYMFFCHKNRLHLIVQTEKELYDKIQQMVAHLKRNNRAINEYMLSLFKRAEEEESWPKLEDIEVPGEEEYVPVNPDEIKDLVDKPETEEE